MLGGALAVQVYALRRALWRESSAWGYSCIVIISCHPFIVPVFSNIHKSLVHSMLISLWTDSGWNDHVIDYLINKYFTHLNRARPLFSLKLSVRNLCQLFFGERDLLHQIYQGRKESWSEFLLCAVKLPVTFPVSWKLDSSLQSRVINSNGVLSESENHAFVTLFFFCGK